MKRKFKNITNIILISIIMLISRNNVNAQQGGPQGPPPTPTDAQIVKMVEDLDKTLSLTDEQEKEVSKKYFAHFEAVDKIMKAGRPSREDMESLKTNFEKEVRLLLTNDQQNLYSKYLKDQKQKRQHSHEK